MQSPVSRPSVSVSLSPVPVATTGGGVVHSMLVIYRVVATRARSNKKYNYLFAACFYLLARACAVLCAAQIVSSISDLIGKQFVSVCDYLFDCLHEK